MNVSEQELQNAVRETLAEVLAIDPDDAKPSARFFADLGGESIDLLDASFRFEKRFGVKIQFDNILVPEAIKTDGDGRLTRESAAAVHKRLPSLDVEKVRIGNEFQTIQELLTVGVITDFVREKVSVGNV